MIFSLFIKAQEIGISPVKIWTSNDELKDPIGIGISLGENFWDVKFKLEYIHASNERSYYGHLINNIILYQNSHDIENVNSSSSLNAYEISANFCQKLYKEYNFYSGVGVTFDEFKLKRTGINSGKITNFDNDWRRGVFFAFTFSRDQLFWQPITFEALYKIKWLSEGVYTTQIELPFEKIGTGQELQLNLVYKF